MLAKCWQKVMKKLGKFRENKFLQNVGQKLAKSWEKVGEIQGKCWEIVGKILEKYQ